MRRAWMLGGVIAIVAACAGGIRPGYAPFPQAVSDTVSATPVAVIEALMGSLAAEGLRMHWQSPTEGYLLTQWYDLVSRQSGSFDRGRPEQFIRLRFFVDPVGTDRAAVHGEAVSVRTVDPSVMERDAEMMLPPGHAGYVLLERVMAGLARSLGG